LGALDHRLRAEKILVVAKRIDISRVDEIELDHVMRHVEQAYIDRERAALLEGVADSLREKDIAERSSRDHTRAA
jgi:hypothetical protein